MFESTDLNARNTRTQALFRALFGLMTVLLILPVLVILGMLIYKGGSVVTLDFLLDNPVDGMTAGGVFPAVLGTIWLVLEVVMGSFFVILYLVFILFREKQCF